jgi:5-methylcytosine-specific restriction endonuclease McrA
VPSIAEHVASVVADRQAREARLAEIGRKPPRDVKQRFYASSAWRQLRYRIIAAQGGKCQACGRTARDGITLHVDHIEPLSKNWERRLDKTNLQVLCADCNVGKLHLSQEDWR